MLGGIGKGMSDWEGGWGLQRIGHGGPWGLVWGGGGR